VIHLSKLPKTLLPAEYVLLIFHCGIWRVAATSGDLISDTTHWLSGGDQGDHRGGVGAHRDPSLIKLVLKPGSAYPGFEGRPLRTWGRHRLEGQSS
jgi:hypothetical protein